MYTLPNFNKIYDFNRNNSDTEIDRDLARRLKDPVERAAYFEILFTRGVIEH